MSRKADVSSDALLKLSNSLFVYGTLRRGGSRWNLISRFVLDYSLGWRTTGTLYDLGKYPGFVAKGRTSVVGDLITARNLRSLLTRTDEIEGKTFTRCLLWIRRATDANDVRLAWIYCYNQTTKGFRRIRSGEWRAKR